MSFKKTRTLSGMLTFGLFGLSSGVLNAQDVGESGQKAGEALSGIVNTITQAFQGGEAGEAARYELIQMAGTACFVLAVLVISYMIASAVGRFVGGQVTKRVDVTLGKFLSKAIRNLLMLVVVMVALDTFAGIDITAFAAILAALGFAIGMALQGTLGNFAAGIMLLVFRPFKIGDYIVVAGTQGTVEEIDLFTTRLNTPDNRHVIVPNNEIFGNKLENYSRNELRRVDVNVGSDYSADLEDTRRVLFAVADGVFQAHRSDNADDPVVYLVELGASSVDWQLRVWCSPKDYWAVREELTVNAKKALDRAGIGIPFPQMDVHVGGKLLAKAA